MRAQLHMTCHLSSSVKPGDDFDGSLCSSEQDDVHKENRRLTAFQIEMPRV